MVDDFRTLVHAVGPWLALRRALKDIPTSLGSTWIRAGRGAMRSPRPGLGMLGREFRFAGRALRRDPRFSVPVVLVLGSSLAVAVTVLAVINAYLLRPLPYPEPARLVDVDPALSLSMEDAREALEIPLTWERDAFTLLGQAQAGVRHGARPEQVLGMWVTPGFMEAYGVEPALGRTFLPSEWGEGAPSVAVLSHALWQRRFAGDPDILGRTVHAYSSDRPDEAESFTVVGVLAADAWVHLGYDDLLVPIRTLNRIYEGRLRDGIPLQRAEEILTALASARTTDLEDGQRVELTPLDERYTARVRPTLLLILSTALLVLLIACGNVALLFVVRARRRSRELAVRRALGAGRGAVVGHLVAEGLILALLAGTLGLIGAVLGLEALGSAVPQRLGVPVPGGASGLRIDPTVAGAVYVTCAVLGLVLGLLPFASIAEVRLGTGWSGTRGVSVRGGNRRFQDMVMAGQVALSLALLVAAGLAVRSARHATSVDLGLQTSGVVTASLMLRERSYPDPTSRLDFQKRLADALQTVPGARTAGLAVRAPVARGYATRRVMAEPLGSTVGGPHVQAEPQIAASSYFDVLGITLTRGRSFDRDEIPGSPPVVMVSQTLAQDLWPGADPIGKRLQEVGTEPALWRTVVGVVADVYQDPMEDPVGDYYLPMTQEAPRYLTVFMKVDGDQGAAASALEEAVAALDPEIAVAGVDDVASMVSEITGPGRFLAFLLSVFGSCAVALALLGLYGTVAYAAAQRRFEVAVRVALGAPRRAVSALFVRERSRMLVAGLLLGSVCASLVTRLLDGQLRGVEPLDPLTYVVCVAALGVLAVIAVWLPARDAARAQPMDILREG